MRKNVEIAGIFKEIADLLELRGEIPFKVAAYRKGARILEDLNQNIEELYAGDRPVKIAGIGEGLAKKIKEYLQTGKVTKHQEEKKSVPDGMLELLTVPGVGPKTIQLAARKLGVKSIRDLRRAVEDGSLSRLFGMGRKKAEGILKGIQLRQQAAGRLSLSEAMGLAEDVMDHLKGAQEIKDMSPAGSLRRMKETVGDIDILASGKNGEKIIRHFCAYPGAQRVLASGKTKGSILVKTDGGSRQVDLRIVKPAEHGAALQYFTGSKDHNVKLRGLAKDRSLKISEYGVFRGPRRIAGKSEEDVYKALGLAWIPPELREDRGEIEAAATGGLPRLVEEGDIRGDLHVHSNFSDGNASIELIASRAVEMGYEIVAICDHSQSVKYARGVEPERLKRQWEEIERVREKFRGLKILKGTEVDILPGGRLDYADSILEKLDIVVAAVHQGFKKNVTKRILAALSHPLVHVIAHPTGRLISRREGYEVDIDAVIEGAARHGKALELNAFYDRLDLGDRNLLKAGRMGVKISIGTDSHHVEGMAQMWMGVATARRGWLEKKDILNCFDYGKLKKFLKGPRKG